MKNASGKQHASNQQNSRVLLLLGLVFLGISYGAASWAIDSGRISLYAATFISLYIAVRYLIRAGKTFFGNN